MIKRTDSEKTPKTNKSFVLYISSNNCKHEPKVTLLSCDTHVIGPHGQLNTAAELHHWTILGTSAMKEILGCV